MPETLRHSAAAPYPFIVGGRSDITDEDFHTITVKNATNRAEDLLKVQMKIVTVKRLYSMPFGQHNAAFPELKYR